ncbi:unnamed protein product [Linum tenue]|uniref:W2 domain-containing protein n=1 Tax=Linum tenue TaxID=586396 RepID=A0AAV0IFM0_9ROSI|nr:unnamed protein product [Linum tenue]
MKHLLINMHGEFPSNRKAELKRPHCIYEVSMYSYSCLLYFFSMFFIFFQSWGCLLCNHFREEGNDQIVLYLERQQKEADLEELEANFSEFLGDLDLKAPTTIAKEISGIIAKSRVPVIEAAGLLWEAIVKTVKWPGSGTNQKDNEMVAISHLSRCGDVIFEKFCSGNIACQMQLINSVQRTCWREPKMLNLFARVIRVLYDVDVLCEDVILNWFYKGTNADGR